jgi:nucleotide-binding universal stress UspA family protein
VYWPPDQFHRLGLTGVRAYVGPQPEVEQALRAQLSVRLADVFGATTVPVLIQPSIGRVADRLARLATEEEADLLVVGSRHRTPLERVMEGSVSGGVLHAAHVSVTCVPAAEHPATTRPRPITNVLVATDFTDTGNAAIPLAYSLTPPGGCVHLVHVVPELPHGPLEARDIFASAETVAKSETHSAAERRLRHLVLPGYAGPVASQVHVLESNSPAEAIAQGAERLDADVVCLGTHGRSGVSKALLGSVAQAVLHHTQRPVLFARKLKA